MFFFKDFKVVSWFSQFLASFPGFSRWFHGFHGYWLVCMVFEGIFMVFMVFVWFSWDLEGSFIALGWFSSLYEVVSWFWLVFIVFQDIENTPKCTRPDCILARRSSLDPPHVGRHRT